MKDSELRALVLAKFYSQRRAGYIGVRVQGVLPLEVSGLEEEDVLRIKAQLDEHGLVDWKGASDGTGNVVAGVGKITAFGVDVMEGERPAPIPIHVDRSRHVQNIHIGGSHGAVQVAGANSHQSQSVQQDIEKVISAIDGASVSEAAKKEAKVC